MPLLEGEYQKQEKINGEIYNMSPSPDYQHGIVNNNINTIIKKGLKGSLCLVFMENLDYKYQPEHSDNYVIPDVMIICDRKRLKGGSYTGVPNFIVETLSPSTAMRDLTIKKTSMKLLVCRNIGLFPVRSGGFRFIIWKMADIY